MVTMVNDDIDEFTQGSDSDIEIIDDLSGFFTSVKESLISSQASNRKPCKTRAITGLLPFMHSTWKPVIVLELLDLVRQCFNVWTKEKSLGDGFLEEVQGLVNKYHGKEQYKVKKLGPVYQKVSILSLISAADSSGDVDLPGQARAMGLVHLLFSCCSSISEE